MPDRPSPESTRREGVFARTIRLADGAEWGFLGPGARFTPKVVTEADELGRRVERVTLSVGFGYPPQVESSILVMRRAFEHGTVAEQYEAFFSLAALLLIRAHDISLDTACGLLDVGLQELPRLVNGVLSVIRTEAVVPTANEPEVST